MVLPLMFFQSIKHLKTITAQKKKLAAELDAKVSGMYKDAELKVDEKKKKEISKTGNLRSMLHITQLMLQK